MVSLWHEFHSSFDTNDGSLPEIVIEHVSPSGLAQMWAYLRNGAASYAGDAWFWHKLAEQAVLIDSVPNAAQLVVTGEAEIFHTVLQGITFAGAVIPDLGVFVFPDMIALDYRMGAEWDAAKLAALFELLRQLQLIDPNASISLSETFFSPVWRTRFSAAFDAYMRHADLRAG